MKCFILKHLGGKLLQILVLSTQFQKNLSELSVFFFPVEIDSISLFSSD